jgi:hypothetical protein
VVHDAGLEMESIHSSGFSNDDPRKHVYLVKWKGYSHYENMWETYQNLLEWLLVLLKDYCGKNPTVETDGISERKSVKCLNFDFMYLFLILTYVEWYLLLLYLL